MCQAFEPSINGLKYYNSVTISVSLRLDVLWRHKGKFSDKTTFQRPSAQCQHGGCHDRSESGHCRMMLSSRIQENSVLSWRWQNHAATSFCFDFSFLEFCVLWNNLPVWVLFWRGDSFLVTTEFSKQKSKAPSMYSRWMAAFIEYHSKGSNLILTYPWSLFLFGHLFQRGEIIKTRYWPMEF